MQKPVIYEQPLKRFFIVMNHGSACFLKKSFFFFLHLTFQSTNFQLSYPAKYAFLINLNAVMGVSTTIKYSFNLSRSSRRYEDDLLFDCNTNDWTVYALRSSFAVTLAQELMRFITVVNECQALHPRFYSTQTRICHSNLPFNSLNKTPTWCNHRACWIQYTLTWRLPTALLWV